MNHQPDRFRSIGISIISMALALLPTTVTADAGALEACQSIQDNAERLACYDAALTPAAAPAEEPSTPEPAMPRQTAPEPPAPVKTDVAATRTPPAAASEPVPEAAPQANELSDEIGRETVSNVDRDKLAVRGRLTRCARASSGKLVFYFENGQVWRQKSSSRVQWQECDFDVTIGKDVWGYTMVRDGEKRKVRIERVR